ncbi:MAG: Gfo/Idh/MocA family oxidoreductase [Verrucomicrobia bacterium]|nr:Gfo/Idh/MocA family oxidoreductase [Verrucomicrobiota bacterium]
MSPAMPASPDSAATPSLDRRTFLKAASALGLGLAAGSPLGRAAESVSTSRRRRYALVGTGSRSLLYQDAIETDFRDHAELVGLCDTNPGRLELIRDRSQRLGGRRPPGFAAADFERMIATTKPDYVIVTTVDGTHDDYIVRAMEAGCDAISEKPLTTTPEKCQRIVDARARTGRTCRVTFNLRYSPPCTHVKDLLMSGEIGDVLSVDLHWMLDTSHGAEYFRRWHAHKKNSGGLMIHKASHHFDLVNWWLGAVPESVFATGKREFYTPKMARRLGLSGAHERCLTCPEKSRCSFYLDLAGDPMLKEFYLDQEKHDGYFRDRCIFRPEVDIEDTMNVLVRYNTGATLAYSLNAFSSWEGYTVAFNGTKGRLEHSVGAPTAAGRAPYGTTRISILPLRGPAREIVPWTGTGAHQGGDKVMLEDLFLPSPAPDKYLRAADERAGAASALVGMAANRCFTTGQPVIIKDLVRGLGPPVYAPMPGGDAPVPMPPPLKT